MMRVTQSALILFPCSDQHLLLCPSFCKMLFFLFGACAHQRVYKVLQPPPSSYSKLFLSIRFWISRSAVSEVYLREMTTTVPFPPGKSDWSFIVVFVRRRSSGSESLALQRKNHGSDETTLASAAYSPRATITASAVSEPEKLC